ncbi:hypothetical protein [Xenococcus sp. PCC 7305]|uniref:hypothetical protein n=1 Tax=Xenococcus sp. PCC 7305 TaxID=102125 RepID=UPI0011818139|nr:hypothetical protein [Xenococcus sp. PCC 7305]
MSMTLTALSAAYIDFATFVSVSDAWKAMLASIVFIFAGTSTAQLYFSLIIPKVKAQINSPLVRERSTKLFLLLRYFGFYILWNTRFFSARCSITETRILGYLNGLIAFFILMIVQLFYILEKSVFLMEFLPRSQ